MEQAALDVQDETKDRTSPYAEKYVAFVDILGFGDLVTKADKDPRKQFAIVEALETVFRIKPPTKAETGLQAQNFSDSLILSADATSDGLWHLILTLDQLSWNLLSTGVLARGGVCRGNVHHDERIVFGIGVNEAYRLESKVAKAPRVILSRAVVKDAVEFSRSDEIARTYLARLIRDEDGVWFINYLSDLAAFAHQNATLENLRKHSWYAVGEGIRLNIQDQLDELVEDPDVYRKLAWFAKFWNRQIASGQAERESPFARLELAGELPVVRALPFRAH